MGIVVLSGMLDRDSKWHAENGRSEGPARICRPGSRFEFETAVLEGGLGMALAGLSSGRLRQMPRCSAKMVCLQRAALLGDKAGSSPLHPNHRP